MNTKTIFTINGFLMLFILLTYTIVAGSLSWNLLAYAANNEGNQFLIAFTVLVMSIVIFFFILCGFFVNEPNQSVTSTFFGSYSGDCDKEGFFWANPLISLIKVSLRLNNFESSVLKVNDKSGNPVEVAAIISWKVDSPKKANFDVDDYQKYVVIQSEAALRAIAAKYPYDTGSEEVDAISLRGNADEVVKDLLEEVQDKLSVAGVNVVDVRISHLAYAKEIAKAMLQKQQATALVSARKETVRGAIGIVNDAVDKFKADNKIQFTEKDTTAFASNMMLVLCGDQTAQPVINT